MKNRVNTKIIFNKTTPKRDKGFTLAEVLITLGIIGIVAAMTIPNLIKNYETMARKTAWQKAYADFSEIEKTVRLNKNDKWSGTGIAAYWDTGNQAFYNAFKPYMKIIKSCDTNAISEGCWHATSDFYQYTGSSCASAGNCQFWTLPSARGAILNNGTMVVFSRLGTSCPSTTTTGNNRDGCGQVMVDTNGTKPPNTLGKDIFIMVLLEDCAVPYYYANNWDGSKSKEYLYK